VAQATADAAWARSWGAATEAAVKREDKIVELECSNDVPCPVTKFVVYNPNAKRAAIQAPAKATNFQDALIAWSGMLGSVLTNPATIVGVTAAHVARQIGDSYNNSFNTSEEHTTGAVSSSTSSVVTTSTDDHRVEDNSQVTTTSTTSEVGPVTNTSTEVAGHMLTDGSTMTLDESTATANIDSGGGDVLQDGSTKTDSHDTTDSHDIDSPVTPLVPVACTGAGCL